MKLFVPCSIVGGRRFVMATPSVEPVLHVMAFDSHAHALAARVAVTAAPWKLMHEFVAVSCPPLDAAGPAFVWETTPEDLALSGMAGPSGFGVGLCDFVGPDTVVVKETMSVHVDDIDYGSLRSYLDSVAAHSMGDDAMPTPAD